MKQKNILFIANRLDFGGAEAYVLSIANEIQKRKYKVFVASSGGKLVQQLEEGIKHFTIPADAKKPLKILQCSLMLRKIINSNSINIVHTNSVITCLIAKIASLGSKTIIINTAHSWGINKKPLSAKIVGFSADKVVAVSASTADSYIKNGLKKNKVLVVHNGIDTEKFQRINNEKILKIKNSLNIDPEKFIIINIARMEEARKGHEVLLESAKIVIEKYNNVHYLLLGDGYLRPGLENKVKNLNIARNIHFLGNRTDVVNLLSSSDIFCLPSDWEGLPLVIAEAMSCKLPIIATAVNGVPEIVVDNETGFLIKPRDPKVLSEKIIFLIENPEVRAKMANNGYKRVNDHFSLKNLVNRLESIYSEYL
ncbi:MAG: glycosyltransferase family 4 protein [Cyanobacteriota bacterium]